MTGQVKEDLISRLGELGVAVENGRLGFRRYLVSRGEFLQKAQWFHFYDLDGQQRSLDLDPGTLAFYYLPGARGGASVRTTEDRDHPRRRLPIFG